jgi:hypothetical protein
MVLCHRTGLKYLVLMGLRWDVNNMNSPTTEIVPNNIHSRILATEICFWRDILVLWYCLRFFGRFYPTVSFKDLDQVIARWLFSSQFWPLLKQALFFEAAKAVAKIGSSLKSNYHRHILGCPNWQNTLYKSMN